MNTRKVLYLSLRLYLSRVPESGFQLLDDKAYGPLVSYMLYQGVMEDFVLSDFDSGEAVEIRSLQGDRWNISFSASRR